MEGLPPKLLVKVILAIFVLLDKRFALIYGMQIELPSAIIAHFFSAL